MTRSSTLNVSIGGGGTCINTVSAALDKSSVYIGDTVTVSGKLTSYLGGGAPGVPVSLVSGIIADGGAVLANGVTDAAGGYSLSFTFNGAGNFTLWVRAVEPSGCPEAGQYVANGSGLSLLVSANVPPPTTGPSEFVLQGSPALSGTNLNLVYKNTTSAPLSGIVYADVRNQVGQTLLTLTASLTNVPAGGTSGATLPLGGLPSGTYVVIFFVVTPAGVSISVETQITITL